MGCTYEWFVDIQHRAAGGRSVATQYLLLLNTVRIARRAESDGVEAAVEWVDRVELPAVCGRSLAQARRRLYRTANIVWYALRLPWVPGGRLSSLLTPPPAAVPSGSDPPVEPDVFSEDEVERVCAAAAALSTRAACLMQLLFTTGVRIGAAARIRWDQLLTRPGATEVRRIACVSEKGNTARYLFLTDAVRAAFEAHLHHERRHNGGRQPGGEERALGAAVRTLRNDFYRACAAAGLTGSHRHPHNARHTVVHALFAHNNSLPLIAKFLGHRSVTTTDRHYLRLSFAEVLGRIRLPWSRD